jgi:hypothetical protein
MLCTHFRIEPLPAPDPTHYAPQVAPAAAGAATSPLGVADLLVAAVKADPSIVDAALAESPAARALADANPQASQWHGWVF